MNHVLLQSFMMLPLPRFIYMFQKEKGGHGSLQIIHQDNFNYFTSIFRDDHSEYEDHMDILKCIPSIRLSDMPAIDVSEKQTAAIPSEFSPEGAIG